MIRRILAGLALAVLFCGALAATDALADAARGQFFAGGYAPAAPGAVVVAFDSFAVGYVGAWGEPAWSAQHETAASIAAGAAVKRNGAFHACDLPDGSKSVSPAAYAKSGYDLGHMTEAAAPANKPPTFGTCNMVPQRPNLNRKIWAGIEAAVRALAVSDGELYVVTGPEITPGATKLAGVVSVPAKTWKAVDDPRLGAAAYICTNADAPVCSVESVAALAAEIGFDPFPGLAESIKARPIRLPEPTKGGVLSQ
jgi:endonuclease G